MSPKRSSDTSTEFSAGGVVIHGGQVAVIVPVKRSAEDNRVLGLPKGHPNANESAEQAAMREVQEETGLQVELIDKLGDVRYEYDRGGRRRDKRVSFYLFQYRSGSLDDHDHEIEEARWMPLADAVRELSFPGERQMVAMALSRLGSEGRDPRQGSLSQNLPKR